jgi:hypothetical protein
VNALVGSRLSGNRRATFEAIADLAYADAPAGRRWHPVPDTAPVPYINEPWYCCAEPNPEQLRLV